MNKFLAVGLVSVALSVHSVAEVLAQDTRNVTHASTPLYDDLMRSARIQGEFVVAVTVLPSGDVHNALVKESVFPRIDSMIKAHAKRWKFEQHQETTLHEIRFVYKLLPRETPPEEFGAYFTEPATMEIRWKEPMILRTRSARSSRSDDP